MRFGPTFVTPRALAVLLASTALLSAQDFRADSRLVLVPVTVTDRHGSSIDGLTRGSFTVFDDRVSQPIAAFYSEDASCAVGLVLDASESVRNRLNWEKASIHALLEMANPDDDFSVTAVSSTPLILARNTTDLRAVESQVRTLPAGGWTALFDGIRFAAGEVRRSARPCRRLVVLSDGMDNHSRTTRTELMDFLLEADVQVYTILVASSSPSRKGIQLAEDQRGVNFMSSLAEKTGGLSVLAHDTEEPSRAARKLSMAMRNRYVIGFHASGDATSGKWHRITVKIDRSRASVYARSGYRLPAALQ